MIVFIVLVTLLILYIVYENHTRNKELLKYAQTDALTGLYNKETTEQLTDELLSEDENKYHAFLILDVDCFKQINDIYGHAVGDIVLQKFGKLLKGTFREGDILGRIGGDEFGVIMKNIQTKDIAMKKAEELLAKTQAYKIDELKGNNISISIGISTAPQTGTATWISINAPIRHFTRQNEVEKQECATISHENSLLPILLQFQIEGTKRSSSESPSDR